MKRLGLRMGMGGRNELTRADALFQQSTAVNRLPLTTSRATSAWDPVNARIVGPGVMRPRTLLQSPQSTALAHMSEPARTNLLAAGSSEDLTQSVWTKSGAPTIARSAIAPDGTTTACTYSGTGTTTYQTVAVLASTSYAVTFYAQNNGGAHAYYSVYDATHAAELIAPTDYIAQINGSTWTRVTVLFTTPVGCTSINVYANRDGGQPVNLLLWGFQLEAGAWPTTYISNRNLLLQSQAFTTASWSRDFNTAVDANVISPLTGLLGASTITEDTSTNVHQVYQSYTFTAANFTWSIYFKAGTRSWAWINAQDGAGAHVTWFDLTNGVVGTNAGGNTSAITAVPNYPGWYRCTVTRSASAGAGFFSYGPAPSDNVRSYLGASGTLIASHSQLEPGTVATNYWGTSTAIGFRAADSISASLASLVDTRTNLLTYSEQFDNAAWTKQDCAITANTGTDPNGNGYCDQITVNGISGQRVTQAIVAAATGAYTFSVWVKGGTANNARLRIYNTTTSSDVGAGVQFNLTTSWQRVTISAPTGINAGNTITVYLYINELSPLTAGLTAFAFGGHLIQSATDPGPGAYLPTGATAVTAPQTGLSTTAGTIIALAIPSGWSGDQDGATGWVVARDSANNAFVMNRASATAMNGLRYDAGGTEGGSPTHGLINNTLASLVVTWDANATKTFVAGVQTTTDTALTAPYVTANTLFIGSQNGTLNFSGWVGLIYFPRALTASELLAIQTSMGNAK